MRPSKLRFPERIEATERSRIAASTPSFSGPELPTQVAQPKPTTWKPSVSSGSRRPAAERYCATGREPGDSVVLTCEGTRKPRATAFLATSPAAIMAWALEVLVQLAIAAITISPSLRPPEALQRAAGTVAGTAFRSRRSWGRLGPATRRPIE